MIKKHALFVFKLYPVDFHTTCTMVCG